MSDEIQASLEAQIEDLLDSDESKDDSEVDSDTVTDESKDDSDTEEVETTPESDSDEAPATPDEAEEVEFDFHNTSTSIQNLVSKLKNLPEQERNDRISKITRSKELEAVKAAFPDAIKEAAPVSRDELDAMRAELAEMKASQNPEELQKALEIAAKLNTTESITDSRLTDMMLQEQFGTEYKSVSDDPKFIVAYEKFPTLSVEERLGYACSLSPVARKLANAGEAAKQARQLNTKTVSKGNQANTAPSKLTTKDVDSLDSFEQLMSEKFDQ